MREPHSPEMSREIVKMMQLTGPLTANRPTAQEKKRKKKKSNSRNLLHCTSGTWSIPTALPSGPTYKGMGLIEETAFGKKKETNIPF